MNLSFVPLSKGRGGEGFNDSSVDINEPFVDINDSPVDINESSVDINDSFVDIFYRGLGVALIPPNPPY